MDVIIGRKGYHMSKEAYEKFLREVASHEVPFGIYAVEKSGQAHMVLEHCTSMSQLKQKTRDYKKQGFKVYSNGR